jgi:ABC-type transporter Mla MlaB component
MTASIAPVYHFGNADVRACSRHLATVVSVRGEVTADNLGALIDRVRRFVLSDTSFVLDLSDVVSIAPEGEALLSEVDAACAAADVEWVLVTGAAVTGLFDEAMRDRLLPVVESVADALHDFADARLAQRSALLPLLQRSA